MEASYIRYDSELYLLITLIKGSRETGIVVDFLAANERNTSDSTTWNVTDINVLIGGL